MKVTAVGARDRRYSVRTMATVPLPEGYHSVNPYINVADVGRLIEFLAAVFGATEHGQRELTPDNRVGHAEVCIGDSIVMISQASETMPARPCVLFVYTDDVVATYQAALSAGAVSIIEPTDQPWGDRVSGFNDPWNNRWWVATHLREFP